MKHTIFKIFLGSILTYNAFIASAGAYTIKQYFQSIDDTTDNTFNGCIQGCNQFLGTGLTGLINDVEVRINPRSYHLATSTYFYFVEYVNSDYTGQTGKFAQVFITENQSNNLIHNTKNNLKLDFTEKDFIFENDKYYLLRVGLAYQEYTYTAPLIYGSASTTDPWIGGVYKFGNDANRNISDLYFTIDTTDPFDDVNAPQILEILSPESATTTPTNNFDVIFTYYNPADRASGFAIDFIDRINGRYIVGERGDIGAGQYGTITSNYTLATSTYTALISLTDADRIDIVNADVSFNVIDGLDNILGITVFEELGLLATSTCDIYNLSGCFQNALVFAFYPNEKILNKFGDLKTLVETKPPFGYIAVTANQLGGITATGTSSFELETEGNIQTLIFDPIRSGLSDVFYICFGFWFLNRVRKQEI